MFQIFSRSLMALWPTLQLPRLSPAPSSTPRQNQTASGHLTGLEKPLESGALLKPFTLDPGRSSSIHLLRSRVRWPPDLTLRGSISSAKLFLLELVPTASFTLVQRSRLNRLECFYSSSLSNYPCSSFLQAMHDKENQMDRKESESSVGSAPIERLDPYGLPLLPRPSTDPSDVSTTTSSWIAPPLKSPSFPPPLAAPKLVVWMESVCSPSR